MKKPGDVLYLTHDGLTDPLGQSQILPYLTGLTRKGFSISIISFEKSTNYEQEQEAVWEICNELKIHWIPLTYHNRPPVLATVFDVLRLRRKAASLLRTGRYTVVHCRSYVTALVGHWLKRKFGVKFLFDMRGFWADERVEGGLWKLNNPLYRLIYQYFKKKEQHFIRDADKIVVLTEAARKFITRHCPDSRPVVIPCCVDTELFSPDRIDPSRLNRLRRGLGIEQNDVVLVYVGSLGTWYLVDEMFSFFERFSAKNPAAKFLVLTPDRHLVPINENIISVTVPRPDVPMYIALATASVCFIKPSFSKTGSSATKMAETLAMEVPVFVNEGWGDIEYLQKILPGIHSVQLDETVVTIPEKPRLTGRFRDLFSLESGVRKYALIYKELAHEGLNK